MPDIRAPVDKNAVERDYLKGMKYKDLAEKYGVTLNTVKSWKQRYNWDRKGMHTKDEKVCTQNNKNTVKKREPIHGELNEKQKLFCNYYIKYRNKTKAYQKAYECSYINACAHAFDLWKNVEVRATIDKQLKELRDSITLDAQDMIQKYIDIAFSDITDYVKFGQEEIPVMGPFGPVIDKKTKKVITRIVNVVKFNESTDVDGTIISEVSQGKDGAKIKLYDKTKAFDWLSNHMDLLDTATKIKLDLEKRKMELAEKTADKDMDSDIEYVVEGGMDEQED